MRRTSPLAAVARLVLAFAAFAALALAGCGGASDGPADAGGRTDAGPRPDTWRPDAAVAPDAGPDARADVPSDAGGALADARDDGPADSRPDDAGPHDAGDAAPDVPDADAAPGPDGPTDAAAAPDVAPVSCLSDFDCEQAFPFHDPCERITCVDWFCRVAWIDDCCHTALDCFDWDPCTVDRCSETTRQCENAPSDDPACCVGPWLVQAGFEDGLPAGWEIEGPEDARAFWHVSQTRAATGAASLVFLDPQRGTYGTGYHELGAVRGPAVEVPLDAALPLLRFDLWLDTEWRLFTQAWADPTPLVYDRLTLHLDDGVRETAVWSSYASDVRGHTCGSGSPCAFRTVVSDLSEWRGRRVRPVWRFDTGDHVDNDWSGVALDNVGVELSCSAPPECFSAGDCNDADPCTDDRCQDGTCRHENNYLPGCCYDYELASWQFDPFSLSGFQVQPMEPLVRWHITERRKLTGAASLRFGHAGNGTYDSPGAAVAGRALSPPVSVPWWYNTTVDLNVWVDVEPWDPTAPERDQFQIVVVTPDDGVETVVWDRSLLTGAQYRTWVPVRIVLNNVQGRLAVVRFQFSSGDAEQNTGEGVYVDDIRVTRRCTF
jgi:hypothetical protein